MMNSELKYVDDCWYCNTIIEQIRSTLDLHKTNLFRTTDIVKLVDGEDEKMPKKMSRKTAFNHLKDLKKKNYLINIDLVSKGIVEIARTNPFDIKDQYFYKIKIIDAEYIRKTSPQYLILNDNVKTSTS
jgi:hypothetical protein